MTKLRTLGQLRHRSVARLDFPVCSGPYNLLQMSGFRDRAKPPLP